MTTGGACSHSCALEACRLPTLPYWLQDNHLLLTRCWLLQLNSEYITFQQKISYTSVTISHLKEKADHEARWILGCW